MAIDGAVMNPPVPTKKSETDLGRLKVVSYTVV